MVAAVEALTGGHEPAPTPLRVRLCRRLALGRWARDRERELATTGVGNGGEGTHPCELFSGGEVHGPEALTRETERKGEYCVGASGQTPAGRDKWPHRDTRIR
jgi:hypothetical protein